MNKDFISDVPDSILPYLNEIAERLWDGHAAIMVGAGFSKNAGNGFPDWNQLGDLFYQKAHGAKPDSAKQKYLNVLRLAEEVQAAIGRPALENLMRLNIPDLTIEPSGLHVELLELPWVDVFTTNYDTLIERASAKVVNRRYEPVVNKEDIPYASKPRIVKLHGSFPSERPFIITEEDYRCYPHDYAPFVNTVQQALLENTFCLIGFSGEDPNFLQWIGWIRDNLGRDKSQKIYLLGLFDLSVASLQLLAQRGIIVVDLSCCHGVEKHNHKKAFGKFFEYIRSKKPDTLDWPCNPKKMNPAQGADHIEEIQKITEEWRTQRQAYPGWLILPYDNRENLWAFTRFWVNFLPDKENSHYGQDILYTSELVWRLERCLLPVFSNVAEFCEILLERYWPFHTEYSLVNCMFCAGEEKLYDLPWNEIRHAWLVISLAMLRFYREEGHLEKWIEEENRLKMLSDFLSAEQKEFLNYEGFLFGIFTLDLPTAKQRLENWHPNESLPSWRVKRAAALAEISLINEAELIVKDALEHIRKKLNQKLSTSDLALVSQESNAMLLGKYIQDAAAFQRNELGERRDEKKQYNDRWNDLKRFNCDPWNELELFELILSKPPVQSKDVTKSRGFDIGSVTQTLHFSSTDKEGLIAYSFLRFSEEVGLPFRVGSYTLATKSAVGSLLRISRDSSFWATATLARLGDATVVDSLFCRETVHSITANQADQLVQSYLDALNKCRDDIHAGDVFRKDNYGVRLAELLPEVISRLCCKCSIETKHRILEFITEIYVSPDKTKSRNVRNLLKRLLSSMSEVEQYSIVPDLLKIPFPEDLNPKDKDEFQNPFLLLNINKKPACSTPTLRIHTGFVDSLFQQATLDDADRRCWAISSLVTLYKLQLLDADQNKRLAAAIWWKTDEYGLPVGTDFYKFAFLRLPYPENVYPSDRFKAYVKATPFPIQKTEQDSGVRITGGNIPLVNEIIGANSNGESIWSKNDAVEILQRLLEWWDADKERLSENERKPAGFS
ncbi:MAG: SIR2 family protein, partial [Chlorobiales bacterium]|nr:SIR2 family protein [Chlorobiales bacterium]